MYGNRSLEEVLEDIKASVGNLMNVIGSVINR